MEHRSRDRGGAGVELEVVEVGAGIRDGQVGELGDVEVPQAHGEDLGAQARPVARRAGHLAHVGVHAVQGPLGLGLLALALDEVDRALEPGGVGALPAPAVAELDLDLVVLSEEDCLADLLGQVLPRRLHGEAHLAAQRGEELDVVLLVRTPGGHRALGEGELLVGDDEVGVDLQLRAQSRALRAGAVGSVEGEGARLDLLQGQGVVIGARPLLGEAAGTLRVVLGEVDPVDDDQAVGEAERGLHGVGEPLADPLAHDEAVDHDGDVVLELLLQDRRLLEADLLPVDDRARVARGAQFLQEVLVLTLAAAHHGGQDLEAGPLGQGADTVDDLLGGLGLDACTADRAVGDTGTGVEEAQVVVDLGDGADGGTRVARGRLLVDGHRGREPLDEVHVRLVHLPEELAGVGGQGLDVATLALGEDGVEGEGGLPRAGQAREHDHRVAWEFEVDALEVVLAGTADDELVSHLSILRSRAPVRTGVPSHARSEGCAPPPSSPSHVRRRGQA